MAIAFEREPRVTVDMSAKPYYAHRHGDVAIGVHHGHERSKPNDLRLIFYEEFPEVFGTARVKEIHTGHRHHESRDDQFGVVVEQHPTLAARDAHASRKGYSSRRAARAITYHAAYGRHSTQDVTPEAILAA